MGGPPKSMHWLSSRWTALVSAGTTLTALPRCGVRCRPRRRELALRELLIRGQAYLLGWDGYHRADGAAPSVIRSASDERWPQRARTSPRFVSATFLYACSMRLATVSRIRYGEAPGPRAQVANHTTCEPAALSWSAKRGAIVSKPDSPPSDSRPCPCSTTVVKQCAVQTRHYVVKFGHLREFYV